jgi:hypothetical protein
VQADDIDDALLETLAAIVKRGEALTTGVATSWEQAERIAFPAVVQVSADPPPPPLAGRALVLHSAIVGRAGSPGELLRGAAERRPDATLLFGSRNAEHVRETATAVASLL